MGSSFSTVNANDLEEVQMIAGDERIFEYYVYNISGAGLSLSGATCNIIIFKYGDPSHIIANLEGTVSGSSSFIANFSGSGLSGIYQQQVKITDSSGKIHKPSQGKIVVFPSPS